MTLLRSQSPLDIPVQDLQRCHELLGLEAWQSLSGKRIFITGGTGFVGKWLLATLLDAKERLSLGCQISVLSRDPVVFLRNWPGLATRVDWIQGDVRELSVEEQRFDVIIHAATDVVAQTSPESVFSTCVEGTRQVLGLARRSQTRRLLLVSSGAVYGQFPAGLTYVPETYHGGPDPLLAASAYGEGKRVSEWLAAQASADGLEVKIARVFSLIGPHLPLDKHFAIGNFLRSALAGKEIVIQGDGTAHRSYLYAADMAAWLWAVLLHGQSCRAYNVGGDVSLSIAELANRVKAVLQGDMQITVKSSLRPDTPVLHYAPDITRARQELFLAAPMELNEAISRTANWYASKKTHSLNGAI